MPVKSGAEPGMREGASLLLAGGPLEQFTLGKRVAHVDEGQGGKDPSGEAAEPVEALVSWRQLQDLPDYRSALQGWFEQVAIGGYLIVVVRHAFLYDRQLTLPSPWRPEQRRLYTPALLLQEVEEALVPNSYRIRWLGDLDSQYDYRLEPDTEPLGDSDIALVLERIAAPAWSLHREPQEVGSLPRTTTDFAFEPLVTRVEEGRRPAADRILVLKLDHVGDLIMGLPALERLRRYFPHAKIDLVVGSWNAIMARELGVADKVIAFDAFPRNSSEEEANVEATLGVFRSLVADQYDLAIDLRTDTDTRTLLRAVKAPVKAGIGTRSRFPFMHIALPLDATRNEAARARDERIGHGTFSAQGSAARGHFALRSDKATVERDCAILWGPYLALDPGDYIFDFFLDLEENRGEGLLKLDVALDRGTAVAQMIVSGPATFQLPFRVDKPKTLFEARIWAVEDHPSISFSFHGGRLLQKGPGNLLHQSEYSTLLVELIKLRLLDLDMLEDVASL